MPVIDSDNLLKWFYAVAGVSMLFMFALKADKLDAYWVAIIGALLGVGAVVFGGNSPNPPDRKP